MSNAVVGFVFASDCGLKRERQLAQQLQVFPWQKRWAAEAVRDFGDRIAERALMAEAGFADAPAKGAGGIGKLQLFDLAKAEFEQRISGRTITGERMGVS